jgi:hypothetical protein
MGCQTTFETRRTELAQLQEVAMGGYHGQLPAIGQSENPVTDAEVADSFIGSVDPGGEDPWMLRYLELGQVALVLGDILFVHGAVSTDAIGCVSVTAAATAASASAHLALRCTCFFCCAQVIMCRAPALGCLPTLCDDSDRALCRWHHATVGTCLAAARWWMVV